MWKKKVKGSEYFPMHLKCMRMGMRLVTFCETPGAIEDINPSLKAKLFLFTFDYSYICVINGIHIL